MPTIERHDPGSYLHSLVAHGDTLYLAGLVAEDLSQDMKGQTEDILRQLDEVLGWAGSDKSKVLSATIYITDMGLKPQMNEAWKAHFAPEHLPGRATIGVADLGPGVLIEVVTIAGR